MDEWVAAALKNDELVANLLLKLKQSPHPYTSRPLKPSPPKWGHRQPRSKSATRKEVERTRCSPTTPLSWTPSEGYDDYSRSKGTFINETATTTISKRSRRKKTFAELKEEESSLLRDRMYLKKEIATLHIALEEQRAKSVNLKRIKLDLHLQSANKMGDASNEAPQEAILSQPKLMEISTCEYVPMFPTHTKNENLPEPKIFKVEKDAESQKRCFIIPDLNMMPSEYGSKTSPRMS